MNVLFKIFIIFWIGIYAGTNANLFNPPSGKSLLSEMPALSGKLPTLLATNEQSDGSHLISLGSHSDKLPALSVTSGHSGVSLSGSLGGLSGKLPTLSVTNEQSGGSHLVSLGSHSDKLPALSVASGHSGVSLSGSLGGLSGKLPTLSVTNEQSGGSHLVSLGSHSDKLPALSVASGHSGISLSGSLGGLSGSLGGISGSLGGLSGNIPTLSVTNEQSGGSLVSLGSHSDKLPILSGMRDHSTVGLSGSLGGISGSLGGLSDKLPTLSVTNEQSGGRHSTVSLSGSLGGLSGKLPTLSVTNEQSLGSHSSIIGGVSGNLPTLTVGNDQVRLTSSRHQSMSGSMDHSLGGAWSVSSERGISGKLPTLTTGYDFSSGGMSGQLPSMTMGIDPAVRRVTSNGTSFRVVSGGHQSMSGSMGNSLEGGGAWSGSAIGGISGELPTLTMTNGYDSSGSMLSVSPSGGISSDGGTSFKVVDGGHHAMSGSMNHGSIGGVLSSSSSVGQGMTESLEHGREGLLEGQGIVSSVTGIGSISGKHSALTITSDHSGTVQITNDSSIGQGIGNLPSLNASGQHETGGSIPSTGEITGTFSSRGIAFNGTSIRPSLGELPALTVGGGNYVSGSQFNPPSLDGISGKLPTRTIARGHGSQIQSPSIGDTTGSLSPLPKFPSNRIPFNPSSIEVTNELPTLLDTKDLPTIGRQFVPPSIGGIPGQYFNPLTSKGDASRGIKFNHPSRAGKFFSSRVTEDQGVASSIPTLAFADSDYPLADFNCTVRELKPQDVHLSKTGSFFVKTYNVTFPSAKSILVIPQLNICFNRSKDLNIEILSSCEHWTYNQNEYSLLRDGKVKLHDYELQPGNYLIENQKLIICAFEEDDALDQTPVIDAVSSQIVSRVSTVSDYIRIVGSIISLVALTTHLTAFCLIPKMRTLAGCNIASLCIALHLAYTFVLIGHVPHNHGVLCVATLVFQHYFFLTVFFCMNTMAYDVWKTLKMPATQMEGKVWKQRKFLLYSIYSWGSPLIITVAAVVVDNVTGIPRWLRPEFGKDGVCSMKNNTATRNVLFVFPAFILLMINAIFFIMSTVIIKKTMEISSKGDQKSVRSNFIMLMRLGIMVGLTWLIGITGAVFENSEAWIIFDLLNSLQGLFVFLLFTCSKKVINQLRRKLNMKQYDMNPNNLDKSSKNSPTALYKATDSTVDLGLGRISGLDPSPETIELKGDTKVEKTSTAIVHEITDDMVEVDFKRTSVTNGVSKAVINTDVSETTKQGKEIIEQKVPEKSATIIYKVNHQPIYPIVNKNLKQSDLNDLALNISKATIYKTTDNPSNIDLDNTKTSSQSSGSSLVTVISKPADSIVPDTKTVPQQSSKSLRTIFSLNIGRKAPSDMENVTESSNNVPKTPVIKSGVPKTVVYETTGDIKNIDIKNTSASSKKSGSKTVVYKTTDKSDDTDLEKTLLSSRKTGASKTVAYKTTGDLVGTDLEKHSVSKKSGAFQTVAYKTTGDLVDTDLEKYSVSKKSGAFQTVAYKTTGDLVDTDLEKHSVSKKSGAFQTVAYKTTGDLVDTDLEKSSVSSQKSGTSKIVVYKIADDIVNTDLEKSASSRERSKTFETVVFKTIDNPVDIYREKTSASNKKTGESETVVYIETDNIVNSDRERTLVSSNQPGTSETVVRKTTDSSDSTDPDPSTVSQKISKVLRTLVSFNTGQNEIKPLVKVLVPNQSPKGLRKIISQDDKQVHKDLESSSSSSSSSSISNAQASSSTVVYKTVDYTTIDMDKKKTYI